MWSVLVKFCFASSLLSLKQPRSFYLVFGVRGLVSLESFVKFFFFFKGGLWVITKKKMGQIISANESHSIQNSATSLDCNTCHAI